MLKELKKMLRSSDVPEYYTKGASKKIALEKIDGFGPIATAILKDHRTYLHYDRLYTLWQAVQRVRDGDVVIEVGAWKGGSSKFIHDSLRFLGKTNQLYVCDTFCGHPEVDPSVDGWHKVHEGFSDASVEGVQGYLKDCTNTLIVVGDIRDTAPSIPQKAIGLLHIDVDVYPATKFCLEHFGDYVREGSVIVVDDYGFTTCKGSKKAVDEYLTDRFWMMHLITGQAVLVCLT